MSRDRSIIVYVPGLYDDVKPLVRLQKRLLRRLSSHVPVVFFSMHWSSRRWKFRDRLCDLRSYVRLLQSHGYRVVLVGYSAGAGCVVSMMQDMKCQGLCINPKILPEGVPSWWYSLHPMMREMIEYLEENGCPLACPSLTSAFDEFVTYREQSNFSRKYMPAVGHLCGFAVAVTVYEHVILDICFRDSSSSCIER